MDPVDHLVELTGLPRDALQASDCSVTACVVASARVAWCTHVITLRELTMLYAEHRAGGYSADPDSDVAQAEYTASAAA